MSRSRSGSRAAPFRAARTVVALGCVLLVGCRSDAPTGTAQAPAGASIDWRNTTFTVTCDGIVPGGFRANLVGGRARVPADGSVPPHYAYYDVQVTATASGDVDGDGAPDTVVLVDCSPQPSNGVVQ